MSKGTGALSGAPEFPRTLQAVKDADGDQWKIADAVLLEVGEPGDDVNNDSGEQFKVCAEYLAERGYEYEPGYLRQIRNTAHVFRKGAHRSTRCTFTAHYAARSPEVLEEAIRRNGGEPPAKRFVEAVRRELLEAEETAKQKKERKQKEIKRKAEEAAKLLEDQKVADEVAKKETAGGRKITNAVKKKEKAEREKARKAAEQQAEAEGLPLPAFVPKMIDDISTWSSEMDVLTEQLGSLPSEDPLVEMLLRVVTEHVQVSQDWVRALGGSVESSNGSKEIESGVISGSGKVVA